MCVCVCDFLFCFFSIVILMFIFLHGEILYRLVLLQIWCIISQAPLKRSFMGAYALYDIVFSAPNIICKLLM